MIVTDKNKILMSYIKIVFFVSNFCETGNNKRKGVREENKLGNTTFR